MGRILGLGGYKESGKDAFAEALPSDVWAVLGMSNPLLEASLAINPYLPDVELTVVEWERACNGDYTAMKSGSAEYRGILQRMGTDFGRNMVDENIWVNIAVASIKRELANGKSVVVTGMRFPNELEAIRNLGGSLGWVERNGIKAPNDLHVSESSVSAADFDFIIYNNSTLADLKKLAKAY